MFERAQLGDDLFVTCLTVNGSGTPTAPDDCPTCAIYTAAGTQVLSQKIPVCDRYGTTGFFQGVFHLDERFSAGHYLIHLTWAISSTNYGQTKRLEVVAGGDANGSVLAMYHYVRPHASFLVYQTDSGRIKRGRNPRIT